MSSPVIKKVERGRPKKFSRHELIIMITELFWTYGYQSLSINVIATELGLTRSSLYNYFKTKEALFLECLEYYIENSPTSRFRSYLAGDPVGPLLHLVFNEICEKRSDDLNNRGCLATNTFNELVSKNTSLGEKLLATNIKRKNAISRIIQCAINQKEIENNIDSSVLANIIISFMNGLNIHAKTNISKHELQQMSVTFLHTLGFKESTNA